MRYKKITSLKILSCIMTFLFCFALLPTTTANAFAAGKPGIPKISSNKWGGDTGGDYDITFNMYYGNNGTSYKLYEKLGVKDYKVISEGTLTDNSPSAQSLTIPIRDRKLAGTYSYYLELTNSFGTSTSNTLDLNVGDKNISKNLISGIDDNGSVYQFTIPQGHSEYKIENYSVQSPKYSVISSNTDSVKATIKNENVLSIDAVSAGRSGLKIIEATSGDVRYVGARVKNADGTNPGMPKYLSMGSVSQDTEGDLNFWRDSANDLKNKRTDVRYIYINGGPKGGWRSWTMQDGKGDGDRARTFIKESQKLGMIPFFVFYNIPDNDENFKVDISHIQSKDYMEGYYKDLKYLLDICKEFGDDTVGIIFEPDFLGYMMQQSGKRPSEIPATVDAAYSSGILSKDKDPKFENNVTGLVNSINYTVKKYYPQAYYGWQFNIWSFDSTDIPGQGLLHKTEFIGQEKGRDFIKDVAKSTANYYNEAGITNYGASFISIDKYGLDGGFEDGAADNPKKSKWLWNADIWNNYLLYTKTLHETTKLPVILWQLPVGHLNGSTEISPYTNTSFPTLTNKVNSYEDSAPNYFLGDTFIGGSDSRNAYFGANLCNDPKIKVNGEKITWGDHMQEAKDAGIISMLFGAGVNGSTHSTGTPPDDSYWFITKIQKYYQNPLKLN
ncbi:hypothetical protein SAMN02745163_03268 [Clostridium cavendishii DSM 21758]|uniref:Uncharacterized protein n=1 Tax=Clostridium cavendishii DSM 21758 TaxID=1121302 RepID=A0A1M6Q2H1_9CLOT|nr:hypothetical protein [Clostridium cavendishii]SHK14388.1 hypothetical protein SAMN02745163_03268 [Clostridium cavendishii DSM 21758]